MGQRNRRFIPALRERFIEFLRSMHGGKFARLFIEHLRAVAASTRRLVSRALGWRGLEEARDGGDGRPSSERASGLGGTLGALVQRASGE